MLPVASDLYEEINIKLNDFFYNTIDSLPLNILLQMLQ